MKNIFLILMMMVVFMAQSFSFESSSIIHGDAVMEVVENIGEVLPVITTDHDFMIFDIDNFESLKLEISTDKSIVNLTDFGLHRQNLFLYSQSYQRQSTQSQLKESNIFHRPCVSHDKEKLIHILC